MPSFQINKAHRTMLRTLARAGRNRRTGKATQNCSNSDHQPPSPPTSKQPTRSTRSRKTPSTTSSCSPSSSVSHSPQPSRSSSQTREDTPRESKAPQDCPNSDPLPTSPTSESHFASLKQPTRSMSSRKTPSPSNFCSPSSSISSHSSQPSRSSSQTHEDTPREDTPCTSTSSFTSAPISPSGSFINSKSPAPRTDTLRNKSNDQSNTCDSNPKTFHHRESQACDPDFMGDIIRPERSILRSDAPKEWVHVLNVTLEEIYQGKRFRFRLIRYDLSGKKTIVPLDVTVPLGSRDGTKVIVSNIGSERKDGTRQDIVFLLKVLKHKRFSRVRNDLLLEVRLPWIDSLSEKEGEVQVEGIDGKVYVFPVNFCNNGLLSGTTMIPNAGPHLPGGKGRGRIIVRLVLSRLIFFFTLPD